MTALVGGLDGNPTRLWELASCAVAASAAQSTVTALVVAIPATVGTYPVEKRCAAHHTRGKTGPARRAIAHAAQRSSTPCSGSTRSAPGGGNVCARHRYEPRGDPMSKLSTAVLACAAL